MLDNLFHGLLIMAVIAVLASLFLYGVEWLYNLTIRFFPCVDHWFDNFFGL